MLALAEEVGTDKNSYSTRVPALLEHTGVLHCARKFRLERILRGKDESDKDKAGT